MIRHIVAIDRKRGIAKDGVQPWKLPEDEQYFSDMTKTKGAVVLMGSTTFRVIGRPLPARRNVVASRDTIFTADGVTVIHDIDKFLDSHEDVWIIGGAQIYATTLARADELYITEIDADFGCDTFYTDFSRDFTILKEGEKHQQNGLTFSYNVYKHRPQAS